METEDAAAAVQAKVSELCRILAFPERAQVAALLADDAYVVARLGMVMDRTGYLASLANFEAEAIAPRSLAVRLIGHGEALVRLPRPLCQPARRF